MRPGLGCAVNPFAKKVVSVRSVPLRLLSLAVLPAALLAGCADAPSGPGVTSPGTATASANGEFDKITVAPGKDSASSATLTLPTKPFRVKDPVSRVLKEGTGAAIGDKAWLDAAFSSFSGVDAKQLATSAGPKATLRVGEPGTPEVFTKAFKGQKVGAQMLIAMPASTILNEQQVPAGMTLDDTVLYVIEATGSRPVLDKASGTAVAPKAGLPTVEVPDDPKQPAKITVPATTPLKETVTQSLITGSGKKVEKGQMVRVTYTGVRWRDPSKPFDYSGKQDPPHAEFQIGAGKLIKAWDNGVVGQNVGSRLLLVVQPADGYGAAGRPDPQDPLGGIKGDDVLIFVMDILDAYSA